MVGLFVSIDILISEEKHFFLLMRLLVIKQQFVSEKQKWKPESQRRITKISDRNANSLWHLTAALDTPTIVARNIF